MHSSFPNLAEGCPGEHVRCKQHRNVDGHFPCLAPRAHDHASEKAGSGGGGDSTRQLLSEGFLRESEEPGEAWGCAFLYPLAWSGTNFIYNRFKIYFSFAFVY